MLYRERFGRELASGSLSGSVVDVPPCSDEPEEAVARRELRLDSVVSEVVTREEAPASTYLSLPRDRAIATDAAQIRESVGSLGQLNA